MWWAHQSPPEWLHSVPGVQFSPQGGGSSGVNRPEPRLVQDYVGRDTAPPGEVGHPGVSPRGAELRQVELQSPRSGQHRTQSSPCPPQGVSTQPGSGDRSAPGHPARTGQGPSQVCNSSTRSWKSKVCDRNILKVTGMEDDRETPPRPCPHTDSQTPGPASLLSECAILASGQQEAPGDSVCGNKTLFTTSAVSKG